MRERSSIARGFASPGRASPAGTSPAATAREACCSTRARTSWTRSAGGSAKSRASCRAAPIRSAGPRASPASSFGAGRARSRSRSAGCRQLSNTYRIVGTRGVIEGSTTDFCRFTLSDDRGRPRHVEAEPARCDYHDLFDLFVDNFLDTIARSCGTAGAWNGGASLHPADGRVLSLGLENGDALARDAYLSSMVQSADRVILVTGGGGFIGNRFAEVIHLTRFGRVRVGVRRWASAARAARFPDRHRAVRRARSPAGCRGDERRGRRRALRRWRRTSDRGRHAQRARGGRGRIRCRACFTSARPRCTART